MSIHALPSSHSLALSHSLTRSLTRGSPARSGSTLVSFARSQRARIFALSIALLTFIPLIACNAEDSTAGSDPALTAIDAFIAANPVDREKQRWKNNLPKPPKVEFDADRTYSWKLDTNVGVIQFKLETDTAPMHASSTIYLTRLGFYDGIKFHRVIKGFMAQGGDPDGNGRGGPGYKYAGEFSPTTLHDSPGILSMANAGPGTDGSQFFITFKATPQLNNRHTVFGKADSADSLATLKAMEALGRRRDPAPPTEPLFINKATIVIE